MLYHEIAEKFITKLTAYTDYNINIMDEKGIIIASRDPERVGTFHEVAFDIITNNREIVHVSDDQQMIGTKPGVNLPLMHGNRMIGVIGVTGDPEEVHPIAMIVRMSMETMLEYEYQQEQISKRQTQKEQFVYELINEASFDSVKIRNQAEILGYQEKQVRIPILIHLAADAGLGEILKAIKADSLHTSQDISFVTREEEILIFKCLPAKKDYMADYKYLIGEYLHPFMMRARETGMDYRFYIGSIQDQFRYYAGAYKHCCWLKENITSKSRGLFFYDYVDTYMKSITPELEYYRIFNCIEKSMNTKDKALYLETMEALKKSNYNMVTASKDLFVHKNTLAFRFDKIKNRFDMNPVRNAKDREFMEYLLYFLTNMRS